MTFGPILGLRRFLHPEYQHHTDSPSRLSTRFAPSGWAGLRAETMR